MAYDQFLEDNKMEFLATWIRLGINGPGTYVKAWIMLLCTCRSPVFDICVLRLWTFGFKRHILQRESMLEIGSIEANRMKMLRPDLLVSAP